MQQSSGHWDKIIWRRGTPSDCDGTRKESDWTISFQALMEDKNGRTNPLEWGEVLAEVNIMMNAGNLSDYDPDSIHEIPDTKLAIVLLSTYGEGGDPSDNTAEFWDWVQKAPRRVTVQSALLRLWVGQQQLQILQSSRQCGRAGTRPERGGSFSGAPVGRAYDVEGTTQEDFLTWKDDLFAACRIQLGFKEGEAQYRPTVAVDEDESVEPIDLHIKVHLILAILQARCLLSALQYGPFLYPKVKR
ncbi:uncharacterized protein BP01DRAFT_411524 [Aspergillus saccharolyticus JOP 1030-1]|uniref:Uncharacterized protein n=1 Tax=Aspergillus saccharolyticus JOP 1030-1 TaxID=1450539 RepID=A0A318YYT6_9EURO|nr:hypothetical protein BP01DRAFT_411524 [Aspergillus saccharolyticus JOP 1030-1]PYH40125.1 hypothetical protein BP01DRAFT_411524 [Aspergillus saccharolyticus JOP 1030-1]